MRLAVAVQLAALAIGASAASAMPDRGGEPALALPVR
jgi:hypothetical protein